MEREQICSEFIYVKMVQTIAIVLWIGALGFFFVLPFSLSRSLHCSFLTVIEHALCCTSKYERRVWQKYNNSFHSVRFDSDCIIESSVGAQSFFWLHSIECKFIQPEKQFDSRLMDRISICMAFGNRSSFEHGFTNEFHGFLSIFRKLLQCNCDCNSFTLVIQFPC